MHRPGAVAIDRHGFDRLIEVMRRVRDECAWTHEQTHDSLRPYVIEEAGEVAEAIDAGVPGELAEELGDLLLQVIFHAAVAEDAGDFTIDDVVASITDKLVRRNKHVFDPEPGQEDLTPEQITDLWNSIKAAEKAAMKDG